MTEAARFSRAPKKAANLPAAVAAPVEKKAPAEALTKLTYRVSRARWEALCLRKMRERRSIQQIMDDALAAYLGETA